MTEFFSGNKGEWSEPYALFKLLADGQLYLGDGELNQLGIVMPILSILRQEKNYTGSYIVDEERKNIIINCGNEPLMLPVSLFKEKAELLLSEIKDASGNRAFAIPSIEAFLKQLGFTHLSANSLSKSDIHIVIHDLRTGIKPTLGFSIKSQLGSPATLLNASRATNFIFQINNLKDKQIESINSLSGIKEKIKGINLQGGELKFVRAENYRFSNNLTLIDSKLPDIFAEMILFYYSSKINKICDITEYIAQLNPLNYNLSSNHTYYEYKIKHLLFDVALGMRPDDVWLGKYDATGGYLVVKEDGELLCYHVYSKNSFEDYLYCNTKFDTPSSSRHDFGHIYQVNRDFFIKLNVQIRFL
jgi:type-2 restriction enzyme hpaII